MDAPSGRRDGAALGLVASPGGRPAGRSPSILPGRLLSAAAAVLLVAIIASHYADLPGGSSTSTAMAAPAPIVTATDVRELTRCQVGTRVAASGSPARSREAGLVVTPSSTSTAPACVGQIVDTARH